MLALHCLLVFYLMSSKMNNFVNLEYVTKIVCFGQKLKIACKVGKTLEIYAAAYEMLEKTSPLCRHVEDTNYECDRSQMIQIVRDMCEGKEQCLLGYGVKDDRKSINCHASMYFNVSYRCAPNPTPGKDVMLNPTRNPRIDTVTRTQKITVPTWIRTAKNPMKVRNVTRKENGQHEGSLFFTILGLFVDISLAGEYIGNHSLSLILCVVSSFATGILILIIYALIFKCCSKNKRRRTQRQREATTSRNIENKNSFPPVISTVSRSVNTESISTTKHTVKPLSDISSPTNTARLPMLKETKESRIQHQLISTIRRTHSVDEQTQTNADEIEPVNTGHTGTLSATEMRELGYLVADLKVYESKIEDSYRTSSKARTSRDTSLSGEYENFPTFFYSGGPSDSSYTENKPFLTEKYLAPFPTASVHDEEKHTNAPQREPSSTPQRELRRFPSEISYATSASNTSDEHGMRESFLLGDTGRLPSMQRNYKLGIRGDGFDYIGNG